MTVEAELGRVIAACRGLVAEELLDADAELVKAGEAGVALENLCTQLHDADVLVSEATIGEIARLGVQIGIRPAYWERLRKSYC